MSFLVVSFQVVFFSPAIKGQRGGFYHVAALQRTSCGHPDQSPALLPSFPRKTLLVGLKVKGKEVKEKAALGDSVPISPALK